MRVFCPFFAAFLCLPLSAATRGGTSVAALRQDARQPRAAMAKPREKAAAGRSARTPQAVQPRSASAAAAAPRSAAPMPAKGGGRSAPVRSAAPVPTRSAQRQLVVSRAALATNTELLGTDYAQCRDAYFACMDQFCALTNDQYRRCVCSAKLTEMREREKNFSTAKSLLQSFEDNNLYSVGKTPAEVKSMYEGTAGENAVAEDGSESVRTLSGISDVLAGKGKDTAGNMKDMASIWGTTDLVGGADIATLESTALYNAVHKQCSEMVAATCPRAATFDMVSAAYGMYIEQDCAAYMDSLDKQQQAMTGAAKDAAGLLAAARLDNYDMHNSDEARACLDNVRNDMFGDAGCGKDNIKCVDYTGRFINVVTGEPIYSTDFFMLENAISLAGDTLRNNTNVPYIAMLNGKKPVAEASLGKCRDIAAYVWDEFLRQTLIDLAQRQFNKVRDVRDNCIITVNECYDDQMERLREFASDAAQENTGAQRIGLTEELCQSRLDTCAILYGGGPPGLQNLKDYVRRTQTVKLESTCEKYLVEYAQTICSPVNDNLHGYPYQCRLYDPGLYKTDDDDSLYGKLHTKAKEVCTRTDSADLTTGVRIIINGIMDELKFKMDGLLTTECEKIENATWYTRVLGTFEDFETDGNNPALQWKDLNLPEFASKVGAKPEWGVCMKCPENSRFVRTPMTRIADNNVRAGATTRTCVCLNDYYVYNGTCVTQPRCPTNSKHDEQGYKSWQNADEKSQDEKLQQDANYYESGWAVPYCKCDSDFYTYNDSCINLEDAKNNCDDEEGKTWDGTNKQCCETGKKWDSSAKQCK